MRITFLGATHEVTGSCTLLEAAGKKFLVDCGMEQGPDYYENQELPISPADVDFLLLTHAHIDHSGNLPLLYAKGFRGNIYATDATKDLCEIMLKDSAHIQMFEAEWRNRKGRRSGKAEFIPLYTMENAFGAIEQLVGCPYGEERFLSEGIRIRFVDAGHLMGSSSIEIWLEEEDTVRKIVFSGDIGNKNQPLIKDPQYINEADYVVMESTYGDRSHEEADQDITRLAEVIQQTFDRGGNLVIPSFAVGRTQEMLYFIRQIKEQNLVTGHGDFTVYMDSPLAVEATNIFRQHYHDCYDEEARKIIESGVNPISFSGLKLSVDSASSKGINFGSQPKVIISASGMCEAGRIKHHLKHNLWRTDSTVLFVGYQAVGTLGRALVEGAPAVRLFGEEVIVKAQIKVLPGVSGHADNQGLMEWAAAYIQPPRKVFVNHGDDRSCEIFTERLKDELHYDAIAPYSGMVYDLKDNLCIQEMQGIAVNRKEKKTVRASTAFGRLIAAGERLLAVIRHNEGGANKDLAKFTGQINSLCDKWDR
jgi:metallo-beta-lactamase family protein